MQRKSRKKKRSTSSNGKKLGKNQRGYFNGKSLKNWWKHPDRYE